MKINGANAVQGLYNHNTAPSGVIYTKNDLVLKDNILYVCLSETTTVPDVDFDEWEYYLNTLTPVKDLADLGLPENANKLVTANAVREFLQKSIPGTNSDGTLKVIATGNLNDIIINSKYQLDPSFLITLKSQDASAIPFNPDLNKLYLLTTLGNFSGSNFSNQTLFHQELLQIDALGNTIKWYRTGPSLSTASWRTTNIPSSVQDYVNYIDGVVDKNNSQTALYQDFLSDINSGEYKIWKSISKNQVNLIDNKIRFTDSATPFQSEYKKDKYYRIYLSIVDGPNKFRDHIDVTPDDHGFLNVGEDLSYKRITGLKLNKVQSSTSELIFPTGTEVIGMAVSNTFAI